MPAAGTAGVFDRSHYEDVLIHRVHRWASPEELERRYVAINEFEARQAAAGTKIVKVMLHISSDEQKARLLARLEIPPSCGSTAVMISRNARSGASTWTRTSRPSEDGHGDRPVAVVPANKSGTPGSPSSSCCWTQWKDWS